MALAASVFFLVAVDDGIVRSVSAGVFNIRAGVERLPEMYTWIAWIFALSMALLSYLTTKVARQRLLFALLAVLAAILVLNTIGLAMVERGGAGYLAESGFYPFLFVSSELVRSMANFQIWIVAGGICYTSRAKVLFPLLAATTTLGDIAGGFLVRVLGAVLLSFQLYGLAALIMIAVMLLLRPLVRRYFVSAVGGGEEDVASLAENIRYFARSEYLRLLFLLSIALFALYTAIHYGFNVVARQHYVSEGDITSFFGLFYGSAGLATLVGTTVLLRYVLRVIGVGNIYLWVCLVHAAITATLMAVFQGILPLGAAAVIFAFNLLNFVLLDTIIAPTYQVLIKLVPQRNSDGTRMIMEGGFMLLGGLVGAGLTALHAQEFLSLGELFLLLAVISGAMIAAGWRLKRSYTEVLICAVREQSFAIDDRESIESMQKVVAKSTEISRSLLLHRDDGVREMGIEILRQNPRAAAAVCPALIDHENPRIRAAALDALGAGGRTGSDGAVLALPLLDDDDSEVRLSSARFLARVVERTQASPDSGATAVPAELRDKIVEAVAPRLGGGAGAGLQSEFLVILDRLEDTATAARRSSLLVELLEGEEMEEIIAGIQTASRIESKDSHARVLGHLQHPQAAVREAAIEAVEGSVSDRREDFLALLSSLGDPDPDVVEAAVGVLGRCDLSSTYRERVVEALATCPPKEWEGLVGAMAVQEDQELMPQLMESCRQRLLEANRYLVAVGSLRREAPGSATDLLADQLELQLTAVQSGVTRLLGNLGDAELVDDLVERLGAEDQAARENAIELLVNIGDRSLMELLLPTLADDEEERERLAGEICGWRDPTVEAALTLTMESSDTWTQLAAAWTAVSLGRRELLSGLPAEPERPVEEIANESAVKRGDSGMGIQDQPLTSMEKIMFLKESSFFAALPLEELYHIALSIQEESAKEGAVVIKQGTRGGKMYIVVEGKLEVSRSDPDVKGESQRITVLGENQVFGDMALLDDEPRSASVIALEDCKLLSLQRSDLERILRRYSSIAFNMMRILSSRLRDSMAA